MIDSPDPSPAYQRLIERLRQIAFWESMESLLGWDERTYLPNGGAEYRAEQLAWAAGQSHALRTDPRLGEWLDELADSPEAADPHGTTGCTIRCTRRDYERQRKMPASLVEELARAAVHGQHIWVQARKNDDFAALRPHLEHMMELKRQQAAAIGYEDHPYDALLDEFEPGARTTEVTETLENLRSGLVPLVAELTESRRVAPTEILQRSYDVAQQRAFAREAAQRIGFDFERGRIDETDHPFCSSMGPHDCRITTRYNEHAFGMGFFGVLHEAGHGIYDQGLRSDEYGLPSGQYLSLGIHESQSRLWENQVGRSRAFWDYFFPRAKERFSPALDDVELDAFHWAVCDVRPSLIRVEADEVTYNLHIVIRFELETALVEDDLPVADLPDAWRQKYRKYLGLEPEGDADGVMQDIHWPAGLVGYFPTYSLGNLYAAQWMEQAEAETGPLDERFRRGEFDGLREWLTEKIHRQGRRYDARDLVQRIVGGPLDSRALLQDLARRYRPLYLDDRP